MQQLSYCFSDAALLEEALTHRSVAHPNNERLEFLGDSALNFIIAEALYIKYPQMQEGELSRLRANLVNGERLAKLGKHFQLADYLRIGPGEKKTGGAHRESIQADAVEAIIGAVFLDGGFEVCKKTVLKWYQALLSDPDLDKSLKDPKTRLQEYLQGKQYTLPSYSVVRVEGKEHQQTFHVRCCVAGLELATEGSGRSRRKAEQSAAKNYLQVLIKNDRS
jgi:ribonuclease-3